MESTHKDMIVISHPWEFIPKGNIAKIFSLLNHFNNLRNIQTFLGSSHLNYQTSTIGNNKIDNKNANNEQQSNLPKQHSRQVFNGRKDNIQLIGNSDDNNVSLNDFSFIYLNKSPLINNFNFETSVNNIFLLYLLQYYAHYLFIFYN